MRYTIQSQMRKGNAKMKDTIEILQDWADGIGASISFSWRGTGHPEGWEIHISAPTPDNEKIGALITEVTGEDFALTVIEGMAAFNSYYIRELKRIKSQLKKEE